MSLDEMFILVALFSIDINLSSTEENRKNHKEIVEKLDNILEVLKGGS